MSRTSPTQRTLQWLRKQDYICEIVERWIPTTPAGYKGPMIRRDCFGFADILAAKVGSPAVLIQTTSGSNAAARMAKIKAEAKAGIWLASGNKILLLTWSKKGGSGKRKLWEAREQWL